MIRGYPNLTPAQRKSFILGYLMGRFKQLAEVPVKLADFFDLEIEDENGRRSVRIPPWFSFRMPGTPEYSPGPVLTAIFFVHEGK